MKSPKVTKGNVIALAEDFLLYSRNSYKQDLPELYLNHLLIAYSRYRKQQERA